MPQKGYSTGRDVTVVVVLPDGTPFRFGRITGFRTEQMTTDQRLKFLDGQTDNLRYYDGWSGDFRAERTGPELDQYFAAQEANYYAGGTDSALIIQQTIVEPNGAVSQFRFENVLLKYADAGDWGSDKSVSQTLSFMASRRIQQA